ncbi:MAG: hydroxymethylglutaryl-CoA lyase [Candidatus Kapaibacterium sp.]|nr:hydroxymethylglutaryl-CoA lyase [Ignavibacteriota bacterium]MCB9220932.1 hydroxymethylglutaryl-CoA lyase [Ignavibacteria bacterium]
MKLIECPRDAMQGIKEFIPTERKIEYINSLLKVGFDTLDFGSFVSPKAIPQLKDTAEVLEGLDLGYSNTKLLAIVANGRGADDASDFEEISYLGYPFSISEEFQKRNTNADIEESFDRVRDIQEVCEIHNKKLVVYISMAFGNPYNEKWDAEIVAKWINKLEREGIEIFSLADTIGVSTPESIKYLYENLVNDHPSLELGVHLHSKPESAKEKIKAAYESGCKRIDSAIRGFGGCPMAKDDLVGNISTEDVLEVLKSEDKKSIDMDLFNESREMSYNIFS